MKALEDVLRHVDATMLARMRNTSTTEDMQGWESRSIKLPFSKI
jgi:hypothetical protein